MLRPVLRIPVGSPGGLLEYLNYSFETVRLETLRNARHRLGRVQASRRSAGRAKAADCDHVIVGCSPDVTLSQSNDCARLTDDGEELHFQSTLRIDVDYRSDVACPKAVLQNVTGENHFVVQLNHHQSGYAVTSRG